MPKANGREAAKRIAQDRASPIDVVAPLAVALILRRKEDIWTCVVRIHAGQYIMLMCMEDILCHRVEWQREFEWSGALSHNNGMAAPPW